MPVQENIIDEMFEMEKIDHESSTGVSRAIKDYESFKKDNDKTKKHLEIALTQTNNGTEIYKDKSVQQLVSSISSKAWTVHDVSYGKYSGYRFEYLDMEWLVYL